MKKFFKVTWLAVRFIVGVILTPVCFVSIWSTCLVFGALSICIPSKKILCSVLAVLDYYFPNFEAVE